MGESLLEKAGQCRRLAASIINQNDPAVARLIALADEWEAQAKKDDAQAVQAAVQKEVANETAPEMPIAAMKPPDEQPEC